MLGGFCVSSVSSPYDVWTTSKKRQRLQQQLKRKTKTNSRSSHLLQPKASLDRKDSGAFHSVLKNFPRGEDDDKDNKVECVPPTSSTVADVGILGCDIDEICVENTDSGLGGFCATLVPSRRLENETEPYFLTRCEYPYCDCTSFDKETGTGSISCRLYNACLNVGMAVYGCYNVCVYLRNVDSYEDGEMTSRKACQEFVAQDEDEPQSSTVCLSFDESFKATTMTLDGQECSSCPDSYYCDCTNVAESAMVSFYYFTGSPIIQECQKIVEGAEPW